MYHAFKRVSILFVPTLTIKSHILCNTQQNIKFCIICKKNIKGLGIYISTELNFKLSHKGIRQRLFQAVFGNIKLI